jgi:uncharacterized protein (TIGR00369 family)
MDASIESDALCFCCGADNERGIHMKITYPEKGMAESIVVVPQWFTGWKDMTHGGFLSTILDEIMAHACIGTARSAVTAELTVRFKRPVRIGATVRAVGKVEETRGRLISTQGWLYDDQGNAVVSATARFVADNASQ